LKHERKTRKEKKKGCEEQVIHTFPMPTVVSPLFLLGDPPAAIPTVILTPNKQAAE
jgi:hypothetical protein